jgi:hypothetical protein
MKEDREEPYPSFLKALSHYQTDLFSGNICETESDEAVHTNLTEEVFLR